MTSPEHVTPPASPMSSDAKAGLEARFATPIASDNPVNPDDRSPQPFVPRSAAESKAGTKTKGGGSPT